jgi:protein-S-isoprenylcysteine O-methyltransferase Ste14
MVVADVLAIWIGRALGTRLDERVIRPVAATAFFAFGAWLGDTSVGELTGTSVWRRALDLFSDRPNAWMASIIAVTALVAVWATRRRVLGRGVWPHRPAAAGTPRWWVRVVFGTAVLLGIANPLLAAAGPLTPIDVLAVPGLVTIGAGLLLLGLSTLLVAKVQVGSVAGSAVPGEQELATHGLFSRVRNPAFTGMLVAVAGMLVMVPTALSTLSAILMVVAAHLHVRAVHEPALARVHGVDYVGYAGRVGRFLPRFR